MTRNGKRELLEAIRPRYLWANKADKARILDEFVATTGYHRKYAIRLLKRGVKPRRSKKPGRSKTYQGEVVIALIKIWAICDRICSRRLHPFLSEMVTTLEHHGELQLSEETRQLRWRASPRRGMTGRSSSCRPRLGVPGEQTRPPPRRRWSNWWTHPGCAARPTATTPSSRLCRNC
jgi:hypothetical protein